MFCCLCTCRLAETAERSIHEVKCQLVMLTERFYGTLEVTTRNISFEPEKKEAKDSLCEHPISISHTVQYVHASVDRFYMYVLYMHAWTAQHTLYKQLLYKHTLYRHTLYKHTYKHLLYKHTLCKHLLWNLTLYKHLLYKHTLCKHLLYKHTLYKHLLYKHTLYKHLLYKHTLYTCTYCTTTKYPPKTLVSIQHLQYIFLSYFGIVYSVLTYMYE